MSGRLSKGKLTVENKATQLHFKRFGSMAEAIEHYQSGANMYHRLRPKKYIPDQSDVMLNGDAELDRIIEHADRLVEEAIPHDPRLVKKSGFVRAEDGIDACPSLLAQGDERAFYDWRKTKLADAATCEPVKIVVSTDCREIKPENAAAFIATVKLAQQFRPLEVWWQGAWLVEPDNYYGFAFLVPLVQGDMDFRRIQFVLSSPLRDRVSYRIMFNTMYPIKTLWGGGAASYSYLEGTHAFISEKGMTPDAKYVARHAAHWAGLPHIYHTEINDSAANQYWSPPVPVSSTETPAQRRKREQESERRWEESRKTDKERRLREAMERSESL